MSAKRGSQAEVAQRWRERLARFQRLGCSVTEFCLREGISQPSFFQWRRRLGEEGRLSVGRRVGPAFLPVEVVGNSGRAALASEKLDDGWMQITLGAVQLRVPVNIDEVVLRQLIRVVREEVGAC